MPAPSSFLCLLWSPQECVGGRAQHGRQAQGAQVHGSVGKVCIACGSRVTTYPAEPRSLFSGASGSLLQKPVT